MEDDCCESRENIEPGRDWKILRKALQNLSNAAWEIHKQCPIWVVDTNGSIYIKVNTLNNLIDARTKADELLKG